MCECARVYAFVRKFAKCQVHFYLCVFNKVAKSTLLNSSMPDVATTTKKKETNSTYMY